MSGGGLDHFECKGFVSYGGDTKSFDFNGQGGGGPYGTVIVGGISFSVTSSPGGGGNGYGVQCHLTMP
jgi:hypothetical protein